uniref:Uncharacterized protein n=1 Tax=Rhizophora mucronata TaxID=61149 RepID=A0A2P2PRH4_RHIMU
MPAKRTWDGTRWDQHIRRDVAS